MDYPGKVITKNQVTPTQTSATGVWTLDDAAAAVKNNNWPVAGVPNPISKSLRFNSADSANLTRTPSVNGNRQTWTWSAWIKRANLSQAGTIWGSNFASGGFGMAFGNYGGAGVNPQIIGITLYGVGTVTTNAVFRDPSAWYHIVARFDSTQAAQADRFRLYVNNVQQTLSANLNVTQNANYHVNESGRLQTLGGESGYFNDLYMAEVNHIDGQSLTPSSFGMTDPQTGAWEPIRYTGTYGTNGFYLNFKDATSTTTLGNDYSGNGNNYTPNNFSVTAGAGNDSLTDVPTPWIAYNTTGDVGGVVRGNYATLNPLAKSSVGTLDNGNLQWTSGNSGGGTAGNGTRASIGMNVGKWYTEVTRLDTVFWSYPGISNESHLTSTYNGGDANSWSIDGSGQKTTNNSSSAYGSASWAANDIINIAYDADNGELYFGKNGTWLNSGNPATRTNPAFTSLSGTLFFTVGFSANTASASSVVFNFGQRPFAYTPPAGFLSLCTTNLPNPTIGTLAGSQADDYFNTVTYTGTGTTNAITTVGFNPDFLWFKTRSNAVSHALYNKITGVTKFLTSNTTAAEATSLANRDLLSFDANGFTVGQQDHQRTNENTYTYVAWAWKANGSGSSNTAGSITSTVSANTTSGFSVVTFTGTGATATVGHGLGVAPSMVIVKITDTTASTNNWSVYHSGIDALAYSYALYLNSTAARQLSANFWNNTTPTSTVFTIGSDTNVNQNGKTTVAYCFAAVAGYSAFGSYTGNGSTDGPFVYTGFRPRWVMFKKTSATSNWSILDTSRDDFNVADNPLLPNLSNAESTSTSTSGAFADILSNGFKARGNSGDINDSGATYIYAAFAEFPFKFANAR